MDTTEFKLDTTDRKIAVLNVVYPVIASMAQELRQTVERLAMAACGLVIVAVGWLMSRTQPPTVRVRIVVTIGVLLVVAIAGAIINTLHARYRGVAQVIRNLNEVQLVHAPGAFLPERALFPTDWRQFGAQEWREPIFRVAYVSLAIVTAFAIAGLWLF